MGGSAQAVERAVSDAVALSRAGRHGEAGQCLLAILAEIESPPVDAERYLALGMLANTCLRTGHPDLSLMALRALPTSAVPPIPPSRRCADRLTLANCWSSLGQTEAAREVNEAALQFAIEHGCWADAASASTNLGAIDANAGRLEQALARLQASLGHLAKDDGNHDTDAVTRLALLQVVDALGGDPAPALAASTDLFTRLEPWVGRERWAAASTAFHRLVERHLAAHPEIDADAWKRKTFPQVFGDAP